MVHCDKNIFECFCHNMETSILTVCEDSMNIKELDNQLNSLTAAGQILEGLDQFYAEDCTFQEGNSDLIVGKATQSARLSAMFATLKAFNGATLHNQGIGEDVSFTEWTFDMVGPDGPIIWNEVLRRQWKNGKVVSERFYQA